MSIFHFKHYVRLSRAMRALEWTAFEHLWNNRIFCLKSSPIPCREPSCSPSRRGSSARGNGNVMLTKRPYDVYIWKVTFLSFSYHPGQTFFYCFICETATICAISWRLDRALQNILVPEKTGHLAALQHVTQCHKRLTILFIIQIYGDDVHSAY